MAVQVVSLSIFLTIYVYTCITCSALFLVMFMYFLLFWALTFKYENTFLYPRLLKGSNAAVTLRTETNYSLLKAKSFNLSKIDSGCLKKNSLKSQIKIL